MESMKITGSDLTPLKLYRCIKNNLKIEVDETALHKIKHSREIVEEKLNKGELIYGVNTKVGALLNEKREENELELIKDHAVSKGEIEEKEIARATLLILINQLATGRSTISLETFNFLVNFFNTGAYPIFHYEGSLGASGDLIPLANLVLSLIEGEVELKNRIVSSKEIFKITGEPKLKVGDAIALINSTAYSCAVLAYYNVELMKLFDLSCSIAALTTEVLRCNTLHLETNALNVKKHHDQIIVGEYMLNLLKESKLINTSKNLQEAYSIRCIPQVYGAIRHVIDIVDYCLIREMNSFSGNPVVDLENRRILYSGNFHAELLAFCADMLRIAIASWANMIERRINRLLNPNLNRGLPAFLSDKKATGLMLCQYLAAYYVNELRMLATPACVMSIPVSADQEDFVSMSGNAVSLLKKSVKNLRKIISIELLCGIEASKFTDYEHFGGELKGIYEKIKKKIDEVEEIKEKIEVINESLDEICSELRERFGSCFFE